MAGGITHKLGGELRTSCRHLLKLRSPHEFWRFRDPKTDPFAAALLQLHQQGCILLFRVAPVESGAELGNQREILLKRVTALPRKKSAGNAE